ncbi:Mss4-like protein [Mycotypha africana]|uniref:Mss4-like protein n=1 Tax=Mycotypha africana TaxID=64632 RepID=UPI002301F320|nr:Mss4-like protein [Mycotypha africana]KAI8973551.1 Mss4-like protein [Mycotypha africana]
MATPYKQVQDPLKELVNDQGKNLTDILCPKKTCHCVIFRRNTATLVEGDGSKLTLPEASLPENNVLQEDKEAEEGTHHFWRVGNMMEFENVGFSKTVGTIKYLSCADCDLGPIGYHDTTNPKEFYISIKRVRYAI